MTINLSDGWFCDGAVGRGKIVTSRAAGGNVGIGSGYVMPLSDTTLTIYGMYHLAGETVQVSIGGLDMGDYEVSAIGSVDVDFESDDQGLMTPQYLLSLDGYDGEHAAEMTFYVDDVLETVIVPVVIGKQYTSDGQGLRPFGREPGSADTGRVRRTHEFAALLHNTVEISFGTDFDDLDAVQLTSNDDGETDYPQTSLFSGVYRAVLTDGYSYDSMLCWRVDRPWPAVVCSVSAFLVAEN